METRLTIFYTAAAITGSFLPGHISSKKAICYIVISYLCFSMQKKSWNIFLKAAEEVRQLLVDENPFPILRVLFFNLPVLGSIQSLISWAEHIFEALNVSKKDNKTSGLFLKL